MILQSFPDSATLDEVMKAAEIEAKNQEVCIKYRRPDVLCLPALRQVGVK